MIKYATWSVVHVGAQFSKGTNSSKKETEPSTPVMRGLHQSNERSIEEKTSFVMPISRANTTKSRKFSFDIVISQWAFERQMQGIEFRNCPPLGFPLLPEIYWLHVLATDLWKDTGVVQFPPVDYVDRRAVRRMSDPHGEI